MFINSLKQLLRKPGKALVFFLLTASSTALIVFAAVSTTETNQRIDAAESQFTTIATVSQNLQPNDALLHADMLDFEGAGYVFPPESRPHLLAYNQDLHTTVEQYLADGIHVVTFTPLEDCTQLEQQVPIRIEKAIYNKFNAAPTILMGYGEQELLPGDEVLFSQIYEFTPLEAGKTYIADLFFMEADGVNWSIAEDGYCPTYVPFSTQHGMGGASMDGAGCKNYRVEEVTEGFWDERGRGKAWLSWVEALEWEKNTSPLPVLPTNSLSLLPSFHSRDAYISAGREITPEEFSSGAKVCLLPRELMMRNFLSVGDKIRLPMRAALCGYTPNRMKLFHFNLSYSFTPLNAEGELYDVFWDEEYEIVGEYRQLNGGVNELYYDMIIVPKTSIGAGWEDNIAYFGPMNGLNTSFQIPNGKIAEFNTALHKAVPNASKLEIIYDDNGYEEVMQSQKNARLSSLLLLAVGALAALTLVVLLMYFFVIKERKRTAIEQSLGLSKRQCRVSLMAGILALTLPAVILGSGASWVMTNAELEDEHLSARSSSEGELTFGDMSANSELDDNMETSYFSRDYSLWAESENTEMGIELDEGAVSVQNLLYFTVPGIVFLCVAVLALIMVNGSLGIEPILLMGGQGE